MVVDPHEPYRARHMLRGAARDGIAAFSVLADPSIAVSAAYGVAMQMKIHVERSNRPATFLIDKAGVIRFRHLATTYSDRPDVEKILQVAHALAGIPEDNILPPGSSVATADARKAADGDGDFYSADALLGDLTRSRSGYTLVSVFHPRCAGCLTEAIALTDREAAWKEMEVAVLGLSASADERAIDVFRGKSKATYRTEIARWSAERFQVRYYPTLLVLDREGKEVFRAAEDTQTPVEDAEAFLRKALHR